MIRPLTLVTFLAFIGSGLYLYQVKHQAQLVDRQIRKIRDATDLARGRAGVLRAEYALLNDPSRLAELATAYVADLKPTQPAQWSSMAEIERRLPPVGEPTADPMPLEPEAPPAELPPMAARTEPMRADPVRADPVRAAPLRPAARPATALAAAQPNPPEAIAPTRPAPTAAVASAGAAAGPAKSVSRPTGRAQPATPSFAQAGRGQEPAASPPRVPPAAPPAAPIVQVAAAPLPLAPRMVPSLLPRVSPPAGTTVFAAASRPMPRQDSYVAPPTTTAEAIARIAHGGPVDPSVPVVASALGMARTMMSVTPVSPAAAGTLYPQGRATR